MLSTHWRERANESGVARLAQASDTLAHALHAANDAVARHGASGFERARTIGQQAFDHAQRTGRSTRSLVVGHPLESVLLAGLAGVVIGWVLRHARSPQRVEPATSRKPAARRPTQRRSGSRNAASKSP